MKEEGPDGQGAAGPRYTSVRLGPPKEVYLGGRHEVLSGLDQGGPGKVLTERLTGSIQVKPSRGVLRWQGGRDWPVTADEADVPGEFGLRLSAL